MRILYVAMEHDYGDESRGRSFEHHNFYESFQGMGHEILYFDFMQLEKLHGRSEMNRRLVEIARAEQPDVLFAVLFQDQISQETLRTISESGWTKTVNWFCDDHWRFQDFSKFWAPCFNYVVTTDSAAVCKYREIGYETAIRSQYACNHFLYRKLDLPIEYDVTFVGQPHSIRRGVIEALRQSGLKVHTWGNGWEAGRASQEEMIRIFNQSRINLNLSNCSPVSAGNTVVPLRTRIRSLAARTLNRVPFGGRVKQTLKSVLPGRSSVDVNKPAPIPLDYRLASKDGLDQIKGRDFEVPGCGGCLLTGAADDLNRYYEIGKEVLCYDGTVGDLINQIHDLLADEQKCRDVAEAGYRRTMAEHTYAHRFQEIFREMGLTDDVEKAGHTFCEQPVRQGAA